MTDTTPPEPQDANGPEAPVTLEKPVIDGYLELAVHGAAEALLRSEDGTSDPVRRPDLRKEGPVGSGTLVGAISEVITPTGLTVRRFGFDHHTWSAESFGVMIRRLRDGHQSDNEAMVIIPWSQIAATRVVYNSPEFTANYLAYLRACDHEWISHPHVGHYCEKCRMDMKDLPSVEDPTTTEMPALVIEDAGLDAKSHTFDPQGPPTDALTGVVPPSGPPATIVIDTQALPQELRDLLDPPPDEETGTDF